MAHAYSAAGTYAATLTVTDNRGAVASDQAVITVTTATAGGAYRWAKRIGGAGVSVAPYASAVDSSGNVVVVGAFSGTVNFGGGPLTSAGGSDIYVAKYSSTGTHLWSRRFGDASGSTAYGVAVDTSGSVVVVGSFTGTVNFGGSPLTSAGGLDIFRCEVFGYGRIPVVPEPRRLEGRVRVFRCGGQQRQRRGDRQLPGHGVFRWLKHPELWR